MHPDLHSFLRTLRLEGELVRIDCQVDPELEIAEIHRRTVKENGPALLFTKVKGSLFPVVTNLFGSERRLELAFGSDVFDRVHSLLSCIESPSLGKAWKHRKALITSVQGGKRPCWHRSSLVQTNHTLNDIPFLKTWPGDGGSFLTLPLVYTQSPSTSKENIGMYRVQRHSATHAGLHWQLGKGGSFHFQEALSLHTDLPVTIFLGGPPSLILSAIMPLPENVSELLFASLLLGRSLPMVYEKGLPLIEACDIAIVGRALYNKEMNEGPFGDHFGYLDLQQPFPVFTTDAIYCKKNAIVPATVVGKPLQEDSFIGIFIQKLVRPFVSLLFPSLLDIYSYPETGFHALTSICVKERYRKEALPSALRVLGEGQLSLTKILFVVDDPIPLHDIQVVLPHILARCIPEEDLIVLSSTPNDTLDMTGPYRNHGSKAIFFGLGPQKKTLPVAITTPIPAHRAKVFTPGCLVVDGILSLDAFVQHHSLSNWPLVIVVDDVEETTRSSLDFLWTVFTRFEPAQDIYAAKKQISRNSVSFTAPLLIDARMKSSYFETLQASKETISLVHTRYAEYFPKKNLL